MFIRLSFFYYEFCVQRYCDLIPYCSLTMCCRRFHFVPLSTAVSDSVLLYPHEVPSLQMGVLIITALVSENPLKVTFSS